MHVLAVILARAGSKSIREKCLHPILGRPMIAYTLDHAQAADAVDAIVVTTDSTGAKTLANDRRIMVVDRPANLASDRATVYDAVRHGVMVYEERSGMDVGLVVLLYANIPVRAEGVIDRAVQHLIETGADSVRTLVRVSKQHPDWLHGLDGDRMTQFRENNIYRRQDLEPLYYHDGAMIAVTRGALFRKPGDPNDHFAFLGDDRRGIVQEAHDAVDVDEISDVYLAEAILSAAATATQERTIQESVG